MLDHKFWKNYFEVYDVLNKVLPYQKLLNDIENKLNVEKNDLILDAGVGTGNLAVRLEKRGAKVIGFDFCKEALDQYKMKSPNAAVIFGNLTQTLPFEDDYFNKIVSNNVLYNLPREKRLQTVKELNRILKKGGVIVLSNAHKNFKPIKIYLQAIRQNINLFGYLSTLKLLIKMSIPTLKMFYYNFIIQKEHKFAKNNLFDYEEQKRILTEAGFTDVSKTEFVYAGQAILNSAYK